MIELKKVEHEWDSHVTRMNANSIINITKDYHPQKKTSDLEQSHKCGRTVW